MVFSVLTSCESELDVEPEDDDEILAEDVFNQPNGYQRAIAGVYANLSVVGLNDPGTSNLSGIDAGTGNYIRGLFNLQNLAADEVIWNFENDPGIADVQRIQWGAGNEIVLGFWARATFQISLANEFLRQSTDGLLDQRKVDASTREMMPMLRAEARGLRALANYHLLDLFRRAPFATENDIVGFTQVPEIKEKELFEYIESELLAIEDDLPDASPNNTLLYGRFNKFVNKMVLAKLYLNAEVYLGNGNQRYGDCLRICQEIIDGPYSLSNTYLFNFLADNHNNGAQNEIIFPVIADGTNVRNFGGAGIIIQGQQNAQSGLRPTPESLGVQGFGNLFRVRKELSELFSSGIFINDQRNTLVTQNISANPDNTDAPVPRNINISPDFSETETGYLLAKYSNITSTGNPGIDAEFVDTDFPLFRLADVYLMYAEAQLQSGEGSRASALNFVNMLRERAFDSSLGNITDGELTLDFILDERSRELHWEAHRRQDLIRFGRYTGSSYQWSFKGGSVNGNAISENFKRFPVPESARAVNPNLGQNTGF